MLSTSVLAAARAPALHPAFGRRPSRKFKQLVAAQSAQAAPRASSAFGTLVEQHVQGGVLSREEADRCSRDQLEFLIRKRTGADLSAASEAAPSAAPNGTSSGQARIQAYVADGLLTPDEVATCSNDQLEFLIRKRTGADLSAASEAAPAAASSSSASRSPRPATSRPPAVDSWASPPPPQASAASDQELSSEQLELLREYLRAQEEQEALLQQQLESLKREVQALETEQATTDGGVVPFHAPPLRDDTVTVTNGNGNGAPAWAAQQPAITRAHTTSVPEPAKGTNWAGVAAASVAVVGLSAGLYLASQDSFRPRSAVLPPKAAPAAERPNTPIPFGPQQAAQPTPQAALPPPPPLPPVEDKKVAEPAAAVVEAAPAAKLEAAAVPVPVPAPSVPKPEQSVAPAPVQQQTPAAAAAAAKAEEDKSAQRMAAQKLAAELAADLAAKQAAASLAKTASAYSATGPTAAELAAGAVLAAGAALALPQGRAAARSLLDRLRGEQAVVRAAQQRYEGLKRLVDVQQGDFAQLQEKLAVAQADYVRSLATLRSTAKDLEGLFGRVQTSEKAATALVSDLQRFGANQQAKQLRGEAARVAASVASQRTAVERALQQALKDL